MARRKEKIDVQQYERRATRSTTKAVSVSPTEGIESPLPRRRRGVTPDVIGTPSQNTPAKVRTRRASLADTPQELPVTPMRRSRRLSINTEDLTTPTKGRGTRVVRNNLTLIEQPVPEEDELKRNSQVGSKGRKSMTTKNATGNSTETDTGSEIGSNPPPRKLSISKEIAANTAEEKRTIPTRKPGRPPKSETQKQNSFNPVIKLRKVSTSSESMDVSVSPNKIQTRKSIAEGKEIVEGSKSTEISVSPNKVKTRRSLQEGEAKVDDKRVKEKDDVEKNNDMEKSAGDRRPTQNSTHLTSTTTSSGDENVIVISDEDEGLKTPNTVQLDPKSIKVEKFNESQDQIQTDDAMIEDIEPEDQMLPASNEEKIGSQLPTQFNIENMPTATISETIENPTTSLNMTSEDGDTPEKSIILETVKSDLGETTKLSEVNEDSSKPQEEIVVIPEGTKFGSQELDKNESIYNAKEDNPTESVKADPKAEIKSKRLSADVQEEIGSMTEVSGDEPAVEKQTNEQKITDVLNVSENGVKSPETPPESLKVVEKSVVNCATPTPIPENIAESLNKTGLAATLPHLQTDETSVDVSPNICETQISDNSKLPEDNTKEALNSTDSSELMTKEPDAQIANSDVEEVSNEKNQSESLSIQSISTEVPINSEESIKNSNKQDESDVSVTNQIKDTQKIIQAQVGKNDDAPSQLMESMEKNKGASFSSPDESTKIKFAKSWNQSVKGPTAKSPDEPEFIDAISLRNKDMENSSKLSIETSPKNNDEQHKQKTSDEELLSDESESAISRNEFIDDEAMEVSEDECSLNSSEREYLEQNEIPVQGESIGSDDTQDELDDEEEEDDDDMGSFIVSESEHDKLSGNDSLIDSDLGEGKKKIFKRVIANSDTSLDESEEEIDKPRPRISKRPKLSSDEESDEIKIQHQKSITSKFSSDEESEENDITDSEKNDDGTKEERQKSITPKFSSNEESEEDAVSATEDDTSQIETETTTEFRKSGTFEKITLTDCSKQEHRFSDAATKETEAATKLSDTRFANNDEKSRVDDKEEINKEHNVPTQGNKVEKKKRKSRDENLQISNCDSSNSSTDLNVKSSKENRSLINTSPKSRRCGTVVSYNKDCPKNKAKDSESMEELVASHSSENDNQGSDSSDSAVRKIHSVSRSESTHKSLEHLECKELENEIQIENSSNNVNDSDSDLDGANDYKTRTNKRLSLPIEKFCQINKSESQTKETMKRYSMGHIIAHNRMSTSKDSPKLNKESSFKKTRSDSDSDLDGPNDSKTRTNKRLSLPIEKFSQTNKSESQTKETMKRYSMGHTIAHNRMSTSKDSPKLNKGSPVKKRRSNIATKISSSENDSSSESDKDDSNNFGEKNVLDDTSRKTTLSIRYSSDNSSNAKIKSPKSDITVDDNMVSANKNDHEDANLTQEFSINSLNASKANSKSTETHVNKSASRRSKKSVSEIDLCSTVEISRNDSHFKGNNDSLNESVKMDKSNRQLVSQPNREIYEDGTFSTRELSPLSKNSTKEQRIQENRGSGHFVVSRKSDSMNASNHKTKKHFSNSSDDSEDESVLILQPGLESYNEVLVSNKNNLELENGSEKVFGIKESSGVFNSFSLKGHLNKSMEKEKQNTSTRKCKKTKKSTESEVTSEDDFDGLVKIGHVSLTQMLNSSKSKNISSSNVTLSVANKSMNMESNETENENTDAGIHKIASVHSKATNVAKQEKKRDKKSNESLQAATSLKVSSVNARDDKSSESSDDAANEALEKNNETAGNISQSKEKMSKSLLHTKQKVTENKTSKSDGETFIPESKEIQSSGKLEEGMHFSKEGKKSSAKKFMARAISHIAKTWKEPPLDESTERDLDEIIIKAKKKVYPADDNKTVLKEISKLVSKSLKNISKLDLSLDEATTTIEDLKTNKKKLRKMRQRAKKLEQARSNNVADVSSSSSDGHSVDKRKIQNTMSTNSLCDSKGGANNDVDNSKCDTFVFKSLKKSNQSTPANTERIKITVNDVTYRSSDENGATNDKSFAVQNDKRKFPTADKKLSREMDQANTNGSISKEKLKRVKTIATPKSNVDAAAHSSSDNSFENYLPLIMNGNKKRPALQKISNKNKKHKKFGQESEKLKELIINKIEAKKGKTERLEKRNVLKPFFDISNSHEVVSAFEAFGKTQKRSSPVKNKRKRQLDISFPNIDTIKSCEGNSIITVSEANEWIVADSPKKPKQNTSNHMPFDFEEKAATPKRVNGFEVMPLTPKPIDWKVTSLFSSNLNECSQKKMKTKKTKYNSSSPEKVWTPVGYFEVSDAHPIIHLSQDSSNAKMGFEVQKLKKKKC